MKIKDIKLSGFYYSDERINIGDLESNHFIVTVRNHSSKNVREIISSFIREAALKGIPNYFGEQRFGLQRPNNHLIGKSILKEEFEKAMYELLAHSYPLETEESGNARNYLAENWGEWRTAVLKFPNYLKLELTLLQHLSKHPKDYVNAFRRLPRNLAKIFVYSYQSYLFNLAVSKLIKKGLLTSFELEIPGYDSQLTSIGSSIMDKIMQKEDVTTADFKVTSYPEISCRGTKRPTLFFPKSFKINNINHKNYTISFTLNPSTYATILLKELIL